MRTLLDVIIIGGHTETKLNIQLPQYIPASSEINFACVSKWEITQACMRERDVKRKGWKGARMGNLFQNIQNRFCQRKYEHLSCKPNA